jgi:hypothetical protein
MDAVRNVRATELSPVLYWLLNLRQLPAIFTGRSKLDPCGEGPFLGQLYARGFTPLAETENEIVFGLIGQFWKLSYGGELKIKDPESFIAFSETDYAKVATNLLVRSDSEGSLLSTETRVWAPHPETYKKFSFYWRLISIGSGWTRIMWLRAIRRRAEKDYQARSESE